MNFYEKHLFFCVNKKEDGRKCCADANNEDNATYTIEKLKSLKIFGPGKVRVTKSLCLGRCGLGPSLVIYPEQIWYSCKDKNDLDRVIEQHLLNGKVVDELLMSK